ncbi:MAG: protein-L-isoaspartate O-methyltransferase [Roseiarcus sp.]|jgi:protein-L-isoaspartate(D-aspartate) O-methyltransferase
MTPTPSTQALIVQRRHMVDGQLRVGGVTDLSLLGAFLDTPRESFVAPAQAALAYLDCDQPALGSSGRRLLAPLTLARLLQAAAVAPGERALDVAGGSGYSAAILERLGASVVALESDTGAADAARRALAGRAGIEVVVGDLAAGAPGKGPFDVILVNGAYESLPDALIGQLAEGGRFVGVEAQPDAQEAALIEKSAAGISRRTLFETRAATIEAFRRAPSFAF